MQSFFMRDGQRSAYWKSYPQLGSFRFFDLLFVLHFCVFGAISGFFRFLKWLRFAKQLPEDKSL